MFEENVRAKTGVCGATSLATAQGYAVTTNSSGLLAVSNTGANIDGVLLDNPIVGKAGSYCYDGTCNVAVAATQTLAIGSLLEVGAGGTFILHNAGTVVAKAREALVSNAAICFIAADLLHSAATF